MLRFDKARWCTASCFLCVSDTIDHYYLWIPYLWICLLPKMYFSPPNQYMQCCCGILQTVQCWKIRVTWYTRSQGRTEEQLTCLFQLFYSKKCAFPCLSSAFCFASLCFLLTLSPFKMALKCSAEVLSSVLSRIRLWCVLERRECVLQKLPSGLSYNAVGHELSVNEWTIDIK